MAKNQPTKRRLQPTEEKPARVIQDKAGKGKAKTWAGIVLRPFKVFKFLRFLVPPYIKNSFKELRQVTWPSRKETLKLTFAVFMFAIVFGALITLTDYGLDKIFKKVLLK